MAWDIEDAKQLGYLKGKMTITDRNKNIWFDYCKNADLPYMYTRLIGSGKRTRIHMDLIAYSRRISDAQIQELYQIFEPLMPGLSAYRGISPIGHCITDMKVPTEHADFIAKKLIEYAQQGEVRWIPNN